MDFPKLQHHWNLTNRLFSVISRTLIAGGLTPLQTVAVGVFYSLSQMGKHAVEFHTKDTPILWEVLSICRGYIQHLSRRISFWMESTQILHWSLTETPTHAQIISTFWWELCWLWNNHSMGVGRLQCCITGTWVTHILGPQS